MVAQQIRATTHADIGSDHANLLVALLRSGRVERGIAIENKQQPLFHSEHALLGLNAEARFADGLEGLLEGEADSLSICGMGAESIVSILERNPERIPDFVVLQPNRRPDLIRRWGFASGFHLVDEQVAFGHWPYVILSYRKSGPEADPAFQQLDHQADLLFGPWLLQRREPAFVELLREEQSYWQQFKQISEISLARRDAIERVLKRWSDS
ncbi:MAG: class I SAM-dependent methyltransferase [Rubripirellula sp.]|nr:class I SAM-dependent methyltransferase [Rubripirellula sp.]